MVCIRSGILAVGGCRGRELKCFLLLTFCCSFVLLGELVEHLHKLCRRICRPHLGEISLVVAF